MNKELYKVLINELASMNYDELNKIFGSLTIDEIYKERHNLHVADVCKALNITKAEYNKFPEEYEESYYMGKYEA